MSCDYFLVSDRTQSFVYIGYSWGCGMNEKTIEDRRAVADWIADHVGESVSISLDPPDGYEEFLGDAPANP